MQFFASDAHFHGFLTSSIANEKGGICLNVGHIPPRYGKKVVLFCDGFGDCLFSLAFDDYASVAVVLWKWLDGVTL